MKGRGSLSRSGGDGLDVGPVSLGMMVGQPGARSWAGEEETSFENISEDKGVFFNLREGLSRRDDTCPQPHLGRHSLPGL